MKCGVEKVDLCILGQTDFKKGMFANRLDHSLAPLLYKYRFHGVLSQQMLIFSVVSLKEE